MGRCLFVTVLSICILGAANRAASQEKPSRMIVIDANGKELELKSWKFLTGTMPLGTNEKLPADKKKSAASECLAFREDKSTTYQNGIVTLVGLATIRAIDYDNAKKTVAVTLLGADGNDHVLKGSTKFKDINKLTLEAEADLGPLGVAAVKFHGGALQDGIRGLRFPRPQAVAALPAEQRSALIVAVDKEKHTILDPVPLYRLADGALRTAPTLFFKTTVKIDIAKLKRLKHVEPTHPKQTSNDFKVTLDDGGEHTLTLLTKVDLDANKGASLVGLLGRVPAGHKLFPPHTIAEAELK